MDIESAPKNRLENSEYTHVGWIPCISGHLDFCLMSVGLVGNYIADKVDKKPVTVNYASKGRPDGHCRKVIMQSWVDWRDQLSGDGRFRVISVSDCNYSINLDNRGLTGTLVMFPKEYNRDFPEHHNIVMEKISQATDLMREYKELSLGDKEKNNKWPDYQNKLNQVWDELKCLISGGSLFGDRGKEVYLVEYSVDHYGFSYFKYKDSLLDEYEPLEDFDKYLLARQAFYYIKYSLHKHKHHTQESDALTTIVPLTENKSEIALQFLGQLKRELIRIKRTQRQNIKKQDDSEALGVLGYMRSLLSSLSDKNFISQNLYNREKDWISGMEMSFSAQHDRIRSKVAREDSANVMARQWMAYGLAFFTALSIIWINVSGGNLNFSQVPESSETIEILVEHFHWSALGLFFALLVIGKSVKFFSLLDIHWPRLVRKIFVYPWVTLIMMFFIYIGAIGLILFVLYRWLLKAIF